jgi:hypothetical protein
MPLLAVTSLLRAIADGLNRDKVPTGQGDSKWYAATMRASSHGRPDPLRDPQDRVRADGREALPREHATPRGTRLWADTTSAHEAIAASRWWNAGLVVQDKRNVFGGD